jgi:signal transduction histidine kinase
MAPTPAAAPVDALHLIVGLLTERGEGGRTDFYGRLCEAICRASSVDRAVLFLYDEVLRRVRAAGSHGIGLDALAGIDARLEDAPIAARALIEDRVIEVDEATGAVPKHYVGGLARGALACVPVSAGGRHFGVVLVDRGGAPLGLTDAERETMWTLGKLAALATGAQVATRHQERARELAGRLDLARDIHEQVIQRLFGVSLVLDRDGPLTPDDRQRCADELRAALGDLRAALRRPTTPATAAPGATLRAELERIAAKATDLDIVVAVDDLTPIPPRIEPLLVSTLAEAVRNARKHATPHTIEVRIGSADGTVTLEVLNDGVRPRARRGTGLGLRLASFQALEHGGLLEAGPASAGRWRTRLVVPAEGA